MEFAFVDGEQICIYKDGKVERFDSGRIKSYKENAQQIARSKEWKTQGSGAAFTGMRENIKTEFESSVNGVYLTGTEGEIIYSFSIENTSGIYRKSIADEKSTEAHIINAHDTYFSGGCLNSETGVLVTSVKRNWRNANIAVLDTATGDYKTVTDGDVCDEDPFICPDNADVLYYSSRGVGRDANGEFVGYSPAAVCCLNLADVDVKEVVSSPDFSYFKPVYYGGKLYAVKAPAKQKRQNIFLTALLIPYRILQAIANFILLFIHMFTGKSTSTGGNNPAKGREYDSRQIVIAGNLVNVEKESRKNAGKKDTDYGFVPKSWQLVETSSGEVIASGVADYDILNDGTFIYTNGRRIFSIKDGERKKLADAAFCVKVGCKHSAPAQSSIFSL